MNCQDFWSGRFGADRGLGPCRHSTVSKQPVAVNETCHFWSVTSDGGIGILQEWRKQQGASRVASSARTQSFRLPESCCAALPRHDVPHPRDDRSRLPVQDSPGSPSVPTSGVRASAMLDPCAFQAFSRQSLFVVRCRSRTRRGLRIVIAPCPATAARAGSTRRTPRPVCCGGAALQSRERRCGT